MLDARILQTANPLLILSSVLSNMANVLKFQLRLTPCACFSYERNALRRSGPNDPQYPFETWQFVPQQPGLRFYQWSPICDVSLFKFKCSIRSLHNSHKDMDAMQRIVSRPSLLRLGLASDSRTLHQHGSNTNVSCFIPQPVSKSQSHRKPRRRSTSMVPIQWVRSSVHLTAGCTIVLTATITQPNTVSLKGCCRDPFFGGSAVSAA